MKNTLEKNILFPFLCHTSMLNSQSGVQVAIVVCVTFKKSFHFLVTDRKKDNIVLDMSQ